MRKIFEWRKKGIAILLTAGALLNLTACAVSEGQEQDSAVENSQKTEYSATISYLDYAGITPLPDSDNVQTIKIAYGYAAYPISYTANDGSVSGYDIEILKAVDALLPDYRFEFVPSAGGDDLLLGVQTGKFDGAVRNWFQTEERRQIFSFPEKNLGLSVTGITVRTEDLEKIYDFATLSKAGGRLAPVDPGDGHYTVLKNWCKANPDFAWDFETGQVSSAADAFAWVAEGRYDATFGLEVSFNAVVKAETGSAHQYADKLSWVACAAVPTYVIFSADDKAVADAFDSVMEEIWDSGYPGALQETLYGVNYIGIYGRDGLGFNH